MLHDATARHSYDDLVVIEDPDAPTTAQELAEESVPHIIIIAKVARDGKTVVGDNARHKLAPDRRTTACGWEYNIAFDMHVPEALEGELCTNAEGSCFTAFEKRRHAELVEAAKARIENMETPRQWMDRQEVLSAAREERNRNRKKRK